MLLAEDQVSACVKHQKRWICGLFRNLLLPLQEKEAEKDCFSHSITFSCLMIKSGTDYPN